MLNELRYKNFQNYSKENYELIISCILFTISQFHSGNFRAEKNLPYGHENRACFELHLKKILFQVLNSNITTGFYFFFCGNIVVEEMNKMLQINLNTHFLLYS